MSTPSAKPARRRPWRALLIGAAAVAAVATAVPVAGAATSAPAADPCPFSRTLCLFDGTSFTGERFTLITFTPGGACVSLVGTGGFDRRARSAINTNPSSAALFLNDNCIGDPFQVPGNGRVADFGPFRPRSAFVPS